MRQKKAVAVFPRPTAGPLRPVVHSQTLKYNAKIRAGRGFTFEELKVWGQVSFSRFTLLLLCFFNSVIVFTDGLSLLMGLISFEVAGSLLSTYLVVVFGRYLHVGIFGTGCRYF